ncbi:hypothetical protein PAPYR_7016 [Paratrimastix pyriformis]|uniref:Uncharacterized protein n=1 Tax=Paratrimastix pyriformis TaxID=342808 RepID=A0ABQ8UFJ3_9EUKA|nr:hypothetical protein PAPYR_7016 [Paratrimastix pyriformis]
MPVCFRLASAQLKNCSQDQRGHDESILSRLPSDLLLAIIDASESQLRVYIQLLSLSHSIRHVVRGLPRDLSFEDLDDDIIEIETETDDDSQYIPTADALAALIGPCKDLESLRLPALFGCGCAEIVYTPWVDEAFAGHRRLASLHLPGAESLMPAMERIVGHLPGLVALHLETYGPLAAGFVAALGRSCPNLQFLHLAGPLGAIDACDFATSLAPLASTLRGLEIQVLSPGNLIMNRLEALLGRLTALEWLRLPRCPAQPILTRLAPRLTHFSLFKDPPAAHPKPVDDDWSTMGFGRLECLRVTRRHLPAAIPQLLTQSGATLHSLILPQAPPSLDMLPHLTELDLSQSDLYLVALVGLHPSLVSDQLVSLAIHLANSYHDHRAPVYIESRSLRRLDLSCPYVPVQQPVTLSCPALEDLRLPGMPDGTVLTLACPRLRRLEGLSPKGLAAASAPMPELEVVAGTQTGAEQHLWRAQLLAGSPRLRQLSQLFVLGPPALEALWDFPRLTRLAVTLGLQNPYRDSLLLHQLPAHLRRLELDVWMHTAQKLPPKLLRLDGPGLRCLVLRGFAAVGRIVLRCPALVALHLRQLSATTSFAFDGTPPPLRWLSIRGECPALEAASLVDCLARCGARLRHVALPPFTPAFRQAWPQLEAALGRLPRLETLDIEDQQPAEHLALSCPRLRRFAIALPSLLPQQGTVALPRSVVIESPLLEELRVPFTPALERFELPGRPRFLRSIEGIRAPAWRAQLGTRFPGVMLAVPPRDDDNAGGNEEAKVAFRRNVRAAQGDPAMSGWSWDDEMAR